MAAGWSYGSSAAAVGVAAARAGGGVAQPNTVLGERGATNSVGTPRAAPTAGGGGTTAGAAWAA